MQRQGTPEDRRKVLGAKWEEAATAFLANEEDYRSRVASAQKAEESLVDDRLAILKKDTDAVLDHAARVATALKESGNVRSGQLGTVADAIVKERIGLLQQAGASGVTQWAAEKAYAAQRMAVGEKRFVENALQGGMSPELREAAKAAIGPAAVKARPQTAAEEESLAEFRAAKSRAESPDEESALAEFSAARSAAAAPWAQSGSTQAAMASVGGGLDLLRSGGPIPPAEVRVPQQRSLYESAFRVGEIDSQQPGGAAGGIPTDMRGTEQLLNRVLGEMQAQTDLMRKRGGGEGSATPQPPSQRGPLLAQARTG